MKNNLLLKGAIVLFIFCLQGAAFSASKTLFIKGANITSLGTAVNAPNSDIKFYINGSPLTLYEPSVPPSPVITDFSINSGKVYDKGSVRGRNVQINCNVNDSLSATIWEGTVGLGGYYGSTSLPMTSANFDDPALTWDWASLKVDFKAAPPYKPTISQFAEATTTYTSGSPAVSVLTVTSAAGSGSDGLREVNLYAWKMWEDGQYEPSGPLSGATANILSLDSSKVSAGKKYAFKVGHGNQWSGGSFTWSDKYTYTVAGGMGTGGPDTAVYSFVKQTSGLGVNVFPIAYSDVQTPDISTVKQLVEAINAKAGEPVVTTIGWWDTATMSPQGYVVEIDTNTKTVKSYTASKGAPPKPENAALVKDNIYQVSVIKSVSFEVTGVR